MNKLLVICGPTAIGKTSTGIKLAQKYDGEIISADSRQVYKGMDIGTGKDIEESSRLKIKSEKLNNFDVGYYQISGVPVWLLDVVEPNYQFSVADWLKCADWVVDNLEKRNKLPILVGGTGFYIQSLVEGIDTLGISPDEELRKKLNQWSVEKLQKKLKQIAPRLYQNLNRSDRHNPHRLIRKIEIAKAEENKQFHGLNREADGVEVDVLKIGLMAPRKIIYKRIDQRVEKRLNQGLLDEIKELLKQGYNWDDPGMNTLGYKEFKGHLEGAYAECIQQWKYDEHGYARRQLTWFKRDKEINWFDITGGNWFDDLEKLVNNWYSE